MENPEAADHVLGLRTAIENSARLEALAVRKIQLPANFVVLTALIALAVLAVWAGPSLEGGIPRGDSFAFFLPMYSFMGERLRAFDIPGWNPHILSGAPFAGDPESGWMYLPAMVFFTLLPPVAAYSGYALFHLVLAGTSTYALGRLLGLGVAGAAVAAIAYQFSPFVEGATCCSIRTHIASWLPLALLGVELALRASDWFKRVVAWSITGLAISQMLGGWIGQGAHYGLLAVGAYLVFRSVISPPLAKPRFSVRFTSLVVTGAAILAIGFGLAAAGVIPRIDATNRSNLAGGVYQGTAAENAATGGWHPILALDRVLSADNDQARWYVGGAVFALAVVGIFVSRRRSIALFFAAFSAAALVMTLDPTPLHRLLYLLPQFQILHEHVPSRVLVIFFLGPALLAGMAVDIFTRPAGLPRLLWLAVFLPPLLIVASNVILTGRGREIGRETMQVAFAVSVLLGITALLNTSNVNTARIAQCLRVFGIPASLALLVFWDPAGQGILGVLGKGAPVPRFTAELQGLSCLGPPSDAASVLRQQVERGISRYFGYDSAIVDARDDPYPNYHGHLHEAAAQRLLAGNQAMCLGLQDVQGYNPVQPRRYVEYMTAMNGAEQDYHESDVLRGGLNSPLLDLLNAAYVVVPADADFLERRLFRKYPSVYQDTDVRILYRTSALPRAWLVHQADSAGYGDALSLLASETIDPRRTALLESEPPPLNMPVTPGRESVSIVRYEPDRIEVQVTAQANALLMLSESWDPGWIATVDGDSTQVLVADHALRAVPVPQGEHAVILRYDPLPLRVGLVISLVSAVFLCGVLIGLWIQSRPHLPPTESQPVETKQ